VACLVLLLGGVAGFAQQPAVQKKEPDKKDTQEPREDRLEDLIAEALRNNPDIRVAEAKVSEAEAELQKTRVATAQKVATLVQSIEIAIKVRDEAEQRYRTTQRIHTQSKGVVSLEELRTADLAWKRAIFEVVKLQGEMPGLLGKMPGKLGQQKADADKESNAQAATARALLWLAVQQAVGSGESNSSLARLLAASALSEVKIEPEGSIADRMRKALDKPIDIDVSDKPMNEVLDKISGLLENAITFRIAPAKPRDGATVFHATTLVSVHFSKTPAGAMLQALNDSVPALAFVVRDYGILVCEADSLPPDAVLLHRFWKSGTADSDSKNPPAEGIIQGTITEVDDRSGHVRIHTDGGQRGLAKGHTLEAYREGSNPTYLGTIRILDVAATSAVGKPIGKVHDRIKKGDKVTSKLTEK
jgi:hypothetical protein